MRCVKKFYCCNFDIGQKKKKNRTYSRKRSGTTFGYTTNHFLGINWYHIVTSDNFFIDISLAKKLLEDKLFLGNHEEK